LPHGEDIVDVKIGDPGSTSDIGFAQKSLFAQNVIKLPKKSSRSSALSSRKINDISQLIGSRRNSMGRLEGKVALVTGAARGIGRAVAVSLAREGADVALLDIAAQIKSAQYPLATPAELEEAKRLVEAQGRKAIAIKADVRNSNQMRQAAEQTIKELGKIDILVPNAGLCTYVASLDKMSEAEWDDVIDIGSLWIPGI